jgi:two-component system NarL family response regulator
MREGTVAYMYDLAGQKIKVLIVDDHNVVREGLKRILDMDDTLKVVGEAQNGMEALDKALALLPDVIVMDLRMPKMNGIEATRQIKQRLPHTQILILTLYTDDFSDEGPSEMTFLKEAMEAGASGYLLKDSDAALITMSIHQVYQGLNPIAPSLTHQLLEAQSKNKNQNATELSNRQIEILQMIAEGVSSQEISSFLFISASTVKREIRNIFDKLGVNDRAHAVSTAIKRNIIKPNATNQQPRNR